MFLSIPGLGDRDEDIPVEEALKMYRLIPGAELAIVPGANHMDIGKRFEIFSEIILEFLTRHEFSNSS